MTSMFYTTYRFRCEIQGITEATFDECTGLSMAVEVQQVREGGGNDYVRMLPGKMETSGNLVLKRGIATAELWDWFVNVAAGTVTRKSVTVIITGYDTMAEIRLNFEDTIPVKWQGPTLNAGTSEVAFETIELAHRRGGPSGSSRIGGGDGGDGGGGTSSSEEPDDEQDGDDDADDPVSMTISRTLDSSAGLPATRNTNITGNPDMDPRDVDLHMLTSAVERLLRQDLKIQRERTYGRKGRQRL